MHVTNIPVWFGLLGDITDGRIWDRCSRPVRLRMLLGIKWYQFARNGLGLKVNQFVHVPTSVDTQHFNQMHVRVFANRQTDKHGQKHLPPPLICRR